MESTINDLITSAVESQPVEFGNHFNSLMLGKVYDAVQERRAQIASALFNASQEEVSDEEQSGEENEEDTQENA